jgi:hypothetical protein
MNLKSLLLLLTLACLAFACSAETYDRATGEITLVEIEPGPTEEGPIEVGPKCSDADAIWSCDNQNSTLECRGKDWADEC